MNLTVWVTVCGEVWSDGLVDTVTWDGEREWEWCDSKPVLARVSG